MNIKEIVVELSLALEIELYEEECFGFQPTEEQALEEFKKIIEHIKGAI